MHCNIMLSIERVYTATYLHVGVHTECANSITIQYNPSLSLSLSLILP